MLFGRGFGSRHQLVAHAERTDQRSGREADDGRARVGLELANRVALGAVFVDQRIVIAELHPTDVFAHGRQVRTFSQTEQLGGRASRLDGRVGVRHRDTESFGVVTRFFLDGTLEAAHGQPHGLRDFFIHDVLPAEAEARPDPFMEAGDAHADAVGAANFTTVEAVHRVGADQGAGGGAEGIFSIGIPQFRRGAVSMERNHVSDHAVAAERTQDDLTTRIGDGQVVARAPCVVEALRQIERFSFQLVAVALGEVAISQRVDAFFVPGQLIHVDDAGFAGAIVICSFADGVENLVSVTIKLHHQTTLDGILDYRVEIHCREGLVGFDDTLGEPDTLPELGIDGDAVVGRPQESTALDLDEVQNSCVLPILRGHTGSTTRTANQDALSVVVIGIHGGAPRCHACFTQRGDIANGSNQSAGARCRAALHAHDRSATRANLGEVEQQHIFTEHLLEGHDFHLLDCLCPTFTAVRHFKDVDRATSVEVLGGAKVESLNLTTLDILVHHIDDRHDDGQHGVIDNHHCVVVSASNARTVQQQIEGQEGRRSGRAVRENFHVAGVLGFIAVLQMTTRHQNGCLAQVMNHVLVFAFSEQRATRFESGRATGDALGDISPSFGADMTDHIQDDLDDQIVAIRHFVAVDNQTLRLGVGSDFGVQGHVVTAGNFDDLLVERHRFGNLAVDCAVGDSIANTFCVGTRLRHGYSSLLWLVG